jgi:hypothetical protein
VTPFEEMFGAFIVGFRKRYPAYRQTWGRDEFYRYMQRVPGRNVESAIEEARADARPATPPEKAAAVAPVVTTTEPQYEVYCPTCNSVVVRKTNQKRAERKARRHVAEHNHACDVREKGTP